MDDPIICTVTTAAKFHFGNCKNCNFWMKYYFGQQIMTAVFPGTKMFNMHMLHFLAFVGLEFGYQG